MLYRHAALVVEPSAALGVAAILEDSLRYRGKRVAVVICGSNILADSFSAWMRGVGQGFIRVHAVLIETGA